MVSYVYSVEKFCTLFFIVGLCWFIDDAIKWNTKYHLVQFSDFVGSQIMLCFVISFRYLLGIFTYTYAIKCNKILCFTVYIFSLTLLIQILCYEIQYKIIRIKPSSLFFFVDS